MYCKKKKEKIWSFSPRRGKENKEETGAAWKCSSNFSPLVFARKSSQTAHGTELAVVEDSWLLGDPAPRVLAVMGCPDVKKAMTMEEGSRKQGRERRKGVQRANKSSEDPYMRTSGLHREPVAVHTCSKSPDEPWRGTDFRPSTTPASLSTGSFSNGLSKTNFDSGLSHLCDVWATDGTRAGI